MYLKYKTADGEWRTVTEDGVISRPGMEPSGEWIFLGLQRMGSHTIEFPLGKILANSGWVPRNKQGLVSGHYRVADRDHGIQRLQVSPKIVDLLFFEGELPLRLTHEGPSSPEYINHLTNRMRPFLLPIPSWEVELNNPS